MKQDQVEAKGIRETTTVGAGVVGPLGGKPRSVLARGGSRVRALAVAVLGSAPWLWQLSGLHPGCGSSRVCAPAVGAHTVREYARGVRACTKHESTHAASSMHKAGGYACSVKEGRALASGRPKGSIKLNERNSTRVSV